MTNRLILASIGPNTGKTSMILGLAQILKDSKSAYMKPFGDRMRYHKKKIWDHDAELVAKVMGLEVEPHQMTLGFEHSKLLYMYDGPSLKEKLLSMCQKLEAGKDQLFIEGGRTLTYGASLGLNSLRITRHTDAKLIVVVTGDPYMIMDDLTFLRYNIVESGVKLAGVIINKVQDVEEMAEVIKEQVDKLKINVLGIIPYDESLTSFAVRQVAIELPATIVAGQEKLDNLIEHIYIGSMSLNEVLRKEVFNKNKKLIITSGDRSDIILAAIDSDSSGIVLTNNILPPPNIIARAMEKEIPLLLVSKDTFSVAKQVEKIEPLVNILDTDKIEKIGKLLKKHLDQKKLKTLF